MKIGLPGGLLYYCYYPLWKTFYEELGAEVVESGNTNKKILDLGVKFCVDEACLPVKVYHGHIKFLSEKVDALFVPRVMSICKNEYICPKFCGLPDMIKNSIPGIPSLIEPVVNLRKSHKSIYDSVIDAGRIITGDRNKILKAYKKALWAQAAFEKSMKKTGDFKCSIKGAACGKNGAKTRGTIALVGHPYNLHDEYANMGIRKKIMEQGYGLLLPEMLDENRINENAAKMPKRHFWTFGRIILGAGLSFIANKDVDGIVYVSSFGCGIDSLIEDYLERYIRRDGSIPYMKITIDEHSGEAGFNTRIEAFIDMVRWREENEGNISPYGRNLRGSKRLS